MVITKKRGTQKIYYCEYCGKSFGSYGIADNHEKWDIICGGPEGPEKKARLGKRKKKLERLNELKELLSEERYQSIYTQMKLLDNIKELKKIEVLINEYRKDVDELDKTLMEVSHNGKHNLDEFTRSAILIPEEKIKDNVKNLNFQLEKRKNAFQREKARDYGSAIEIWDQLKNIDASTRVRMMMAMEREKAKDYDSAIKIWEELGEIEEAARTRELKVQQGSVKVAQKVVHGDEVTKTEIKDSVLNKSNVGNNEGEDKFSKLKELKEMFDSGFISEEEMEKIKREILG